MKLLVRNKLDWLYISSVDVDEFFMQNPYIMSQELIQSRTVFSFGGDLVMLADIG